MNDLKYKNYHVVIGFAFLVLFTFTIMGLTGDEPKIHPLKQLDRPEDVKELNRILSDIKNSSSIRTKVGSFDIPGSTGDHSVTGIGFQPRYVEFRISATFTDRIKLGFGWMDYNGNQNYAYIAMQNDTESQNQNTDNCIGVADHGGNSKVVASYVSMDADGFTINFSVVTAGFKIQYKAVR